MSLKRIVVMGILSVLFTVVFSGCGNIGKDDASVIENTDMSYVAQSVAKEPESVSENADVFYTVDTKISDVISDTVFQTYGRLIFPVNEGYYSGETLGTLQLTWYNNINANKTVEIANYMRSHAAAGETIFYDIYTNTEKEDDPAKRDTGCFSSREIRGKSLQFAMQEAVLLM